jgi:c-di-GMP-binding flagellar brake protein YcgR
MRLFQTVRGSMIANRRRYLRVPLQTELTCIVNEKTLRGRTWNVSQGGMQVEVDGLRADEAARISFELPHSRSLIDVLGSVVWVKNDRQGIRFTTVAPKVQHEIDKFVQDIDSSPK